MTVCATCFGATWTWGKKEPWLDRIIWICRDARMRISPRPVDVLAVWIRRVGSSSWLVPLVPVGPKGVPAIMSTGLISRTMGLLTTPLAHVYAFGPGLRGSTLHKAIIGSGPVGSFALALCGCWSFGSYIFIYWPACSRIVHRGAL